MEAESELVAGFMTEQSARSICVNFSGRIRLYRSHLSPNRRPLHGWLRHTRGAL